LTVQARAALAREASSWKNERFSAGRIRQIEEHALEKLGEAAAQPPAAT
jgi:hypothetical protein